MSQYLILVLFLMGWSTTAYGLAHMAHIKCPQWTLNDLVQISPIVVEGTVVSNGQNSPINGKFEVTFKVNTVYKGDLNKYTFVRLTLDSFTSSTTTTKNSTTTSNKVECPKVLKGFKHRKKRKYLIFAKDSRLFGLEVLAAPLKRTKRSKLALHRALCSYKTKYCHEDDSHIRNVRLGQTVRLNCQEKIPKFETSGRPRTKWKKSYTKWLKNGKPMKLLPNNIVIKSKRSKSVLKLKILHENDIATYTCVSNYRHYRKKFQLKIPSNGKFRKNKRKYNFTYTLFRKRGGLCLMKSPKNMCQNLPYLWIKKTQIVCIILNHIEFLTKPLISEDCWVS